MRQKTRLKKKKVKTAKKGDKKGSKERRQCDKNMIKK